MIRVTWFMGILLLGVSAMASVDSTLTTAPSLAPGTAALANINRGNFEISGSLALEYTSAGGFLGQLDPTIKYFFFDHLSIGGTAYLQADQMNSSFSAGPSATYYIGLFNHWAPFVGQDFVTAVGSATDNTWVSTTHIGANYFITQNVAFGPSVSLIKTLGDGTDSSFNLLLLGAFGLYF